MRSYKSIYKGTGTGVGRKAGKDKVFAGGVGGAGGLVYYIKLCFSDGLHLYKIGYTSMTIVKRVEGYYDRRTRSYKGGMGLPATCHYKIIATLYKGSKETAYRREQALHSTYQMYRWKGPNRLRNGNTELYLTDVLGLDRR